MNIQRTFRRFVPICSLLALCAACGSDATASDDGTDTDGDGISDADETAVHGTSPLLADTDGDGLSDATEIHELGFDPAQDPHKFNPLVADVPQISFELTSIPDIYVIGTSSTETAVMHGISNTQEHANSYSTSQTDTTTHAVEMTHTAGISVTQEVSYGGTDGLAGKTSATANYEFSHATTNETSVSFTKEATKEMRDSVEKSKQTTVTNGLTKEGGGIAVVARIENTGNLAFTLTGFSLSALKRGSQDRTQFSPVTVLEPDTAFVDYPNRTLGPNQAMNDVIFVSEGLTWDTAEALLEDPSGLVLTVSSYELVNQEGVSFTHNNTEIHAKTATVIIDYGPSRPPERFLVATNVDRDAEGRPAGVSVDKIMNKYLHIPYEVTALDAKSTKTGELLGSPRTLTKVRDFEASAADNAYWIVSTTSKAADDPLYDFDALTLKAGDVLHLVYFQDPDQDRLGAREEFLYGTDPHKADSDGDQLDDYEEARIGWKVPSYGFSVFPDPTSGGDYDGDTLNDLAEKQKQTDPWAIDTDADGTSDDKDTSHADRGAGGSGGGPSVGAPPSDSVLELRFDDSLADSSPLGTHAAQTFDPAFYVRDRFDVDKAAIDVRQQPTQAYANTASTPHVSFSKEFAIAVWIKGQSFSDEHIAGQGDWFGLRFGDADRVRFGAFDGDNATSPVAIAQTPNPDDVWTFYVGMVSLCSEADVVAGISCATGDSIIRLFVDGVEESTVVVPATLFNNPGACRFYAGELPMGNHCKDTHNYSNLQAALDDVRIYDRALTPAEILALYHEGGYKKP